MPHDLAEATSVVEASAEQLLTTVPNVEDTGPGGPPDVDPSGEATEPVPVLSPGVTLAAVVHRPQPEPVKPSEVTCEESSGSASVRLPNDARPSSTLAAVSGETGKVGDAAAPMPAGIERAAASQPAPAPFTVAPLAPVTVPVPAAVAAPASMPRMTLSGEFGERLGVAIARQVKNGQEELTVRMDPAELGRIELKLAFDESGSLRVVVSADSTTVMDAMRRDLTEITRALNDAGVRADGQSFRFERASGDPGGSAATGSGSGGRSWGEQRGQRQGHGHGQERRGGAVWERVRLRSGTLDLLA
ncbi:flagellar hook-length control protein FliK [Sphingomonas sp. BN140010]|uniref:Flagellar hook-length control protein FliK n=1 Tax=Sphingomonas arvum TaxID=2992113 RepID=A0ABT3JJ71_9SPHN|nr:flagellar hook-length control protein FliK [Sphingomonas sp. BN140010]MCW3798836.1 flagellar hook-length control protein FliK [Sphingomonas sp. BN140010]